MSSISAKKPRICNSIFTGEAERTVRHLAPVMIHRRGYFNIRRLDRTIGNSNTYIAMLPECSTATESFSSAMLPGEGRTKSGESPGWPRAAWDSWPLGSGDRPISGDGQRHSVNSPINMTKINHPESVFRGIFFSALLIVTLCV